MDLRVSAIGMNPLRSVTTYGTPAAGLRPQRSPRDGQDPMTPVAKALGLSTADVNAQLRSGKSLNDLADAAGLAHDDLVAAIRAGLPSDSMSRRSTTSATGLAAAAASTTATAATNAAARIPASTTSGAIDAAGAGDPTAAAERIAATKGRPRPGGPRGPGDLGRPGGSDGVNSSSSTGHGTSVIGDPAKLGELSSHFDVDEGRLSSASSAKELVDLLQQNGADLSQLKNVLKSGDLLNTTA